MSKFHVVIFQPPLSSVAYIHEFLSTTTEMYKIIAFKKNKYVSLPPKPSLCAVAENLLLPMQNNSVTSDLKFSL